MKQENRLLVLMSELREILLLGTITDYDGKFSIDVSSKDILVFSYIGYKTQEVKVGDQKSLRIKMKEDSETLGEVVVTAFGTGQKKESIVGSIQTVRPNDLKVPSANLSNSFCRTSFGSYCLSA